MWTSYDIYVRDLLGWLLRMITWCFNWGILFGWLQIYTVSKFRKKWGPQTISFIELIFSYPILLMERWCRKRNRSLLQLPFPKPLYFSYDGLVCRLYEGSYSNFVRLGLDLNFDYLVDKAKWFVVPRRVETFRLWEQSET